MDYLKLLEDRDIEYDIDTENWHLKNEKQILKKGKANSFDISYCAWKHFSNSLRLFIVNLNHLTKDELTSLKQKKIPPTIKGSCVHSVCVYIDTTWKGLHTNASYIWWEYSWIGQRGLHKYKTMEELLDDLLKKWQRETDYPTVLVTKITNTKIGCNYDSYIERGILSPIVKILSSQ